MAGQSALCQGRVRERVPRNGRSVDRGPTGSVHPDPLLMFPIVSLAAVFEQTLTHEQAVTAPINSLYELCFTEKAFAEMTELQWFLTEQVEEEKAAREIVAKFRLIKGATPPRPSNR